MYLPLENATYGIIDYATSGETNNGTFRYNKGYGSLSVQRSEPQATFTGSRTFSSRNPMVWQGSFVGDFNPRVGMNYISLSDVISKHGAGSVNINQSYSMFR